MPKTVIVTELWIIGPAETRRHAERSLNDEHGHYVFSPVFHPTKGHEVASVVQSWHMGSLVNAGIASTVANHPGLSWVLSYVTNDDSHGQGNYHGHVKRFTCQADGHVTSSKPGGWQADHNHALDILTAMRKHWYPAAARNIERVPLPQGTILQKATWRDDGPTVARLLASSATMPASNDPEAWWSGLARAVRPRAHRIQWALHEPAQLLDGRSDAWSRSACDAWLEAFPTQFRDIPRAIGLMRRADMMSFAGLTHWGAPAHAMYSIALSDGPDDPSDVWCNLHNGRPFVLPLRAPYVSGAELVCHECLLGQMTPDQREGLLNTWLDELSGTVFSHDATITTDVLPLLERWYAQGLLPEDWFTAETMDWAREHEMLDRPDGRWMEAKTLHAMLERKDVVPLPRTTRPRL